jgi:hypothetical protein
MGFLFSNATSCSNIAQLSIHNGSLDNEFPQEKMAAKEKIIFENLFKFLIYKSCKLVPILFAHNAELKGELRSSESSEQRERL